VGCRRQLDKAKLKSGTRVALDMTTLTIMRYLPREVDPLVYNMSHEDPGDVTYSAIGGLSEQIRELREVCSCVQIVEFRSGSERYYTRISHDFTLTF
jgi:26S proteasome regulatory subunit T4